MSQKIGQTDIKASKIALGCMRMASLEAKNVDDVITKCLDLGIDFFDHADIYGKGQSEQVFGDSVKRLGIKREDMVIQSKCGIREGYFDFSKKHILASVEGILNRLGTDNLDILALHRPDALMDVEEVADAFYELRKSGKVRYFGVSNQNRYQMELLEAYLEQPLAVNQVQFSPAHTPMIDAGLNVNMVDRPAYDRDNGILDYCQLKKITPQAWSPFQIDLGRGIFMGHPDYQDLTRTIEELAGQYGVSHEAIIIAWILRHPAKIQAIVGSMNPVRLEKIVAAKQIELSREDWYRIYRSAGNRLP